MPVGFGWSYKHANRGPALSRRHSCGPARHCWHLGYGPSIIPSPDFSGEAILLKASATTSSVSENQCWAEEAMEASLAVAAQALTSGPRHMEKPEGRFPGRSHLSRVLDYEEEEPAEKSWEECSRRGTGHTMASVAMDSTPIPALPGACTPPRTQPPTAPSPTHPEPSPSTEMIKQRRNQGPC